MAEALRALDAAGERCGFRLEYRYAAFGGAAIDLCGEPLPEETWEACRGAAAVLLGSVGGPRWDDLPRELRPETGGLLALRKRLGLYANLRPAFLHPELRGISPLALRGAARPVDLVTVRELASGIYFGEPRELGGEEALDSLRYRRWEIERVSRVAFRLARGRRRRVTSVDKANVLATSQLWRRTVAAVAADFPDVELRHMYVDNAAMQLLLDPLQFDVLLTENMFGDILSDESAAICGSLGMLPSASLGEEIHLFEPAGGSAPDIAGRGVANPVAQILSAAMMLEHSLQETEAAQMIASAVDAAIRKGCRTADIAAGAGLALTTEQMGRAIAAEIGG
jgi:3-isopropylmalate dehydrogenase